MSHSPIPARFTRAVLALLAPLLLLAAPIRAQQQIVYKALLNSTVDAESWLHLHRALEEADSLKADLIILEVNTYGGAVDYADTMRTRILNSRIPIWAFVNNQAISAGALITIACDSIYMRPGSSIGASTVVDGSGAQVPDKYQSFMRSMMRATAQAKGSWKEVNPSGDTVTCYRRNPDVAQAMVDPTLNIEGIIDSGHVLTLTVEEAQSLGYCEAKVNSIDDILQRTGFENAQIKEYTPRGVDRVKGFFLSPVVAGILIMLIIGGLYFELQTPGIGLPLIISIVAAVAFFIPLYLDGLIDNIDWILCLVGLVLLLLEIFVIPGFGIAGISGLIALVVGLTLAMVDNHVVFNSPDGTRTLFTGAAVVIGAITLSIFACTILGGMLIASPRVPMLALRKNLSAEEGYVGVQSLDTELVGAEGITRTVLRPSGKVEIEGITYDAVAIMAFIEPNTPVRVMKIENNQLYVTPTE